MARREAWRPVKLLHVLLEPPNHDAIFVLGTGLGQDLAVNVQVLIEQLQQQGEIVGIALVRRGRQDRKWSVWSRKNSPSMYRWVLLTLLP